MSGRLFPELDKLAAKRGEFETVEDFLLFMQGKGFEFGYWVNDSFEHRPINLSELIYEYLEIDTSVVEKERRKLLEQITQNDKEHL